MGFILPEGLALHPTLSPRAGQLWKHFFSSSLVSNCSWNTSCCNTLHYFSFCLDREIPGDVNDILWIEICINWFIYRSQKHCKHTACLPCQKLQWMTCERKCHKRTDGHNAEHVVKVHALMFQPLNSAAQCSEAPSSLMANIDLASVSISAVGNAPWKNPLCTEAEHTNKPCQKHLSNLWNMSNVQVSIHHPAGFPYDKQ